MIETMDKAAAKQISDAVMEALQPVAERFGMTVTSRGGTFDPVEGKYTPRITFQTSGGPEKAFRAAAAIYGLDPDDYGRTFTAQGREFRIVGLNHKARRMPVMADEVATGRSFKFAAEGVKIALRAAVTQ